VQGVKVYRNERTRAPHVKLQTLHTLHTAGVLAGQDTLSGRRTNVIGSPNHPGIDDADDGSLIPAAEFPQKRRGTPPTEEYLRAKAEGLLLEPMTLEARLAVRKANEETPE
jgi:hypothetical protein